MRSYSVSEKTMSLCQVSLKRGSCAYCLVLADVTDPTDFAGMPRARSIFRPSSGKVDVYRATNGYFVPWFAVVEDAAVPDSGARWLSEWCSVKRPGR